MCFGLNWLWYIYIDLKKISTLFKEVMEIFLIYNVLVVLFYV